MKENRNRLDKEETALMIAWTEFFTEPMGRIWLAQWASAVTVGKLKPSRPVSA